MNFKDLAKERYSKRFNIPENIIPVGVLPIGYLAEDGKLSLKHNERYPIEQTVYYNKC